MQSSGQTLVLSFDFEDWNQIVHRDLGLETWDAPGPAFERQVATVLDLLDELGVQATFFVLALTAKNYPRLVGEVVARGHELASHGYAHERVFNQTEDAFRRDLEQGLAVLADLTGRRPLGYRAPAFSINRDTPWAYDVLAELGFRYDSSQYDSPKIPRRIHPVPRAPYRLELAGDREIWEFPIAVSSAGRWPLPVGGGSYWRVLPARVLLRALERAGPYPVLYFHPYECDPLSLHAELPSSPQPRQRLKAAYLSARFNPGRGNIVPRLRAVASRFRLVTYEQAFDEIRDGFRPSTRTLSQEGVLV
jgi:peptidoglycan-N-acetylglucosamine deacetylase